MCEWLRADEEGNHQSACPLHVLLQRWLVDCCITAGCRDRQAAGDSHPLPALVADDCAARYGPLLPLALRHLVYRHQLVYRVAGGDSRREWRKDDLDSRTSPGDD